MEMWDETLIESKGTRNSGRRLLTLQIAAVAHAAVIGILAAASFWFVDTMSLPKPNFANSIPFFVSSALPGPLPPIKGRLEKSQPEVNKAQPVKLNPVQPVTQEQIISEDKTVSQSNDFNQITDFENLPIGDPNGIEGGDPDGKFADNYGGGGGAEGTEQTPIDPTYRPQVNLPVIVYKVEPQYPSLMLKSHRQGIVVLKAVISRTGAVQELAITKSAHPLLDKAAMDAVSRWRYHPATLNGKPVAVYFTVTVSFRLR